MKSILSILPIMALLVACQKQPSSAADGSTNMTPEQYAELFKREKGKADAWFVALDAAKPSAPLVIEFMRLFPNAVVNYRYFTSTHEPGFNVGVDLHQRYELTMQLPVRFDPEGRTVVGYGDPKFYLVEAASQKGRETWYNHEGARHFGSDEWRKVVESGGDFSAVGYTMVTDRPVPGFAQRKVQQ
jgi:hypothetical protein